MHTRAWLFLLCLGSLLYGCRSRHVAIEQLATIQHSKSTDTLQANISWLIIDSLWQLDTVRHDSVMPIKLQRVRRINIQKNAVSLSRSSHINRDTSAYITADYKCNDHVIASDKRHLYLLLKAIVATIVMVLIIRKGRKIV